ncbi:MAG: acetylglutamate kinase, partial [Francisellaceae bacterium]
SILGQLNIENKYINGRRVTDKNTLDVVTMALSGLVNTQMVASLQKLDINALGITGADLNIIECIKRPVKRYDYGYAGDIKQVNTQQLFDLIEKDIVPVICPITHDKKGQILNTNADTIAQSVASALAELSVCEIELYYCFELNGVYTDLSDKNTHLKKINFHEYKEYVDVNIIKDGMLPKLENCFTALNNKVSKVFITDVENMKKLMLDQDAISTEMIL